jgi:hypothetical protein
MTKLLVVWALCATLPIFSAGRVLARSSITGNALYPMAPGTCWTYQGRVRWTHDTNQFSEAKITWRTEIRKVVLHGDVVAAVISGFPFELAWGTDETRPSDSLLIESHNQFYLIEGDRFTDALNTLEQQSADVSKLLSEDDMFLVWPLKTGEKYGDASGMARPDTFYCWFVESSSPADLSGISGAPTGKRDSFSIIYRTMPDHTQLAFAPGVGITKYEYHHHGTVADTELTLVEFHQAPQ